MMITKVKIYMLHTGVEINLRSLGVVFPTRKKSAELFAKQFKKWANHKLIILVFFCEVR